MAVVALDFDLFPDIAQHETITFIHPSFRSNARRTQVINTGTARVVRRSQPPPLVDIDARDEGPRLLTSPARRNKLHGFHMEPLKLFDFPLGDMVPQLDPDYISPAHYITLLGHGKVGSFGDHFCGTPTSAQADGVSLEGGKGEAGTATVEVVDNLSAIKEHFAKFVNPRGSLDFNRFFKACQGLSITNKKLIIQLFRDFDDDASTAIEPDEICRSLQRFLDGEDRNQVYRACFDVYDADSSGTITFSELRMTRGNLTDAMLGITQEQRDCLIGLFKTSPHITNRSAMDFSTFMKLMLNEPQLMKVMFSTLMALYAKKMGISLDPRKSISM